MAKKNGLVDRIAQIRKDVEYSKATMDAALEQIYGDLFLPWEVR